MYTGKINLPQFRIAAVTIAFVSYCFEGLIRSVLSSVALLPLIYLRDLLFLAIVVSSVLLYRQKNLYFIVLCCILSVSALVSLVTSLDPRQIAFGLKVLLPFIAVTSLTVDESRQLLSQYPRWRAALLLLVLLGLTGDFVFDLPFSDVDASTFEIGNVTAEVENRRTWSTGGIERCAGFGRSSFDSACCLLILVCLQVSELNSLREYTVCLICVIGLTITTTKGLVVAFVVGFLLCKFLRSIGSPRSSLAAVVGIIALTIAVPTYFVSQSRIYREDLADKESQVIGSFAERTSDNWPRAYDLIDEPGLLVTGRGLGGVGVAQKLFEPEKAVIADNVFLGLYVQFGLLAIFFVFPVCHAVSFSARNGDEMHGMFLLFMLVVFLYGITTSIYENAALTIIIAAISNAAFKRG